VCLPAYSTTHVVMALGLSSAGAQRSSSLHTLNSFRFFSVARKEIFCLIIKCALESILSADYPPMASLSGSYPDVPEIPLISRTFVAPVTGDLQSSI